MATYNYISSSKGFFLQESSIF
jgi:hypothetical protein